ncbi:aminotransferase class IV [Aureivirga sp. CE67]|uniref:aminotransferase class IV n=1 Tax=Aureivirga sp. CE67 TaxID=1788983 RepID=UPI0018CB318A|nr:aminotransferase class IV [Aureivirga sp. CE67]
MLNFNGSVITEAELNISSKNRAFNYGDAIFETIKVLGGKVVFTEDHYFRLMASMRMLRMEIPMSFTLEFFEEEVLKTIPNKEDNFRIRFTVSRKDGGLYTPESRDIDYLVTSAPLTVAIKEKYTVDLFKDYYVYSGLLSTVKTTNKMLNVVASIFAEENELDNCILLNEKKHVAEVINGNFFLVKGDEIITPALTEGCVKGVVRKKLLEIISKNMNMTLKEATISPFDLLKADELFITNAIVGIQSITNYRKKVYGTEVADELRVQLERLMNM